MEGDIKIIDCPVNFGIESIPTIVLYVCILYRYPTFEINIVKEFLQFRLLPGTNSVLAFPLGLSAASATVGDPTVDVPTPLVLSAILVPISVASCEITIPIAAVRNTITIGLDAILLFGYQILSIPRWSPFFMDAFFDELWRNVSPNGVGFPSKT